MPRNGSNLSVHQLTNDKEKVVHIYHGILFSQKDEILSFMTSRVELGTIMLKEVRMAEEDKHHTISLM
jgi:hypothetical protein